MALSDGQIGRIGSSVQGGVADPALAARLRTEFPGLLVTVCNDDDVVGIEPVWQGQGFNLYLVDGSSHCLALTRDPSVAAGVVVAMLDQA